VVRSGYQRFVTDPLRFVVVQADQDTRAQAASYRFTFCFFLLTFAL